MSAAKAAIHITTYSVSLAALGGVHHVLSSAIPDSSPVETVSLIAGLLTFAAAAQTLGRQWYERLLEHREDDRQAAPKWSSFGIYALLMLAGSSLMVFGVGLATHQIEIVRGGQYDEQTLAILAYTVVVPVFLALLLVTVTLKTFGTRMMDRQKLHLKELARARNQLPAESVERLRGNLPEAPQVEEREAYLRLLHKMLRISLDAASEAGLQLRRVRRSRVATLFLAHNERRCMIPVAMVGGSVDYLELLQDEPPKFFEAREFVEHYNAFRGRRQDAIDRGRTPPDLGMFRRETRLLTSSAGVVFALERKLGFDRPFTRCVTSSFDFLPQLPELQRHRFRFMDMIGIPILVFDRKVGVLLLAARRRHSFHTSDRIYWVIGDMIGAALELGLSLGMFVAHGLPSVSAAPVPSEPAYREAVRDVVNQFRHDFSKPCSLPSILERV